MTKKIYKYATGSVIPEGATYLNTVTQTERVWDNCWEKCWFVWHYYEVEVEEE